ncbi:MAG: hypothetical protein KBF25_02720 [Chitinophagaceae bacterium]|jgi:hypothetical protein|nr:hypothetical protein [Bacteroidota bacterium]MBP9932578.1 hypothetical protein [Chitinophagaceae bacterium]
MMKLLYRLIIKNHPLIRRKKLLNQHRKVFQEGIQTTAEVMSRTIEEDKIGQLFPVRLYLKIKTPENRFEYIQTKALLNIKDLPENGKMIRIKYMPNNTKLVFVH